MKFSWRSAFLMLVLALLVVGSTGCATTESDNTSTRPWNAPKSWQFGVPGMDQMH